MISDLSHKYLNVQALCITSWGLSQFEEIAKSVVQTYFQSDH